MKREKPVVNVFPFYIILYCLLIKARKLFTEKTEEMPKDEQGEEEKQEEEDEEEKQEEEEYEEEMKGKSLDQNLLPHFVISLEATDEFLCEKVMQRTEQDDIKYNMRVREIIYPTMLYVILTNQ